MMNPVILLMVLASWHQQYAQANSDKIYGALDSTRAHQDTLRI